MRIRTICPPLCRPPLGACPPLFALTLIALPALAQAPYKIIGPGGAERALSPGGSSAPPAAAPGSTTGGGFPGTIPAGSDRFFGTDARTLGADGRILGPNGQIIYPPPLE